ncbi:peptidase M28 [Candidatus Koribacter versatilis Ellin345]|uniref:Peptidase M28 n=1 Tax=Koribacter versatilis (strain Ellin345) TaxID=204669 RepID=Q1IIG2_KORVE|nr:M28 family metallopeptidase [Candidatus Koribacter versatilis]ABF43338.1 peptidase M28 [Candidatus Koribacter versatilis Ellin345]
MRKEILLSSLLVAIAAGGQQTGPVAFDGKQWWTYVKVLADDNMEGRNTGSDGEKRAEAYVVEQAKASGLQAAGTNGFYQPVKLVESKLDEAGSSFALVKDGKSESLTLGDDLTLSARLDGGDVEAPLVFVGYGLTIPEKNYDDLAGLDLKGKVAVIFSGSPASIPTELASHAQSAAERWKALKAAGVVGVISIPNPKAMDIPWERIKGNRLQASMRLVELNETADEKLGGYFNPASAQKLFEGSGHSFDEIAALGANREALPHFALKVSVKAKTTIERKEIESANVVAKLVGSDAKLKNEYVVVSAHIDHLGMGEPVNGDRVYNGAMDNGSGSALLLDLARSFKEHPENLKRSVLFVWVTGEEKGLLGSRYFGLHPTVSRRAMVADINTDMFLPIEPMKVITAFGLNETTLGDALKKLAGERNVQVQPDPQPLRNIFIRSDQYSFVRVGVPSIMFMGGSPADPVLEQWLKERYHGRSDDTNQPVDLVAAGEFEAISRALVVDVANASAKPEWKAESFFKRYVAEPDLGK